MHQLPHVSTIVHIHIYTLRHNLSLRTIFEIFISTKETTHYRHGDVTPKKCVIISNASMKMFTAVFSNIWT
jgi:hypothetical protein